MFKIYQTGKYFTLRRSSEEGLKFNDFEHILQVFLTIFENCRKIFKKLKRIWRKLHRDVEILQLEFPLIFILKYSLWSGVSFLILYSGHCGFVKVVQLAVENASQYWALFVIEFPFVHRNLAGFIIVEDYFDPANIEHATIT